MAEDRPMSPREHREREATRSRLSALLGAEDLDHAVQGLELLFASEDLELLEWIWSGAYVERGWIPTEYNSVTSGRGLRHRWLFFDRAVEHSSELAGSYGMARLLLETPPGVPSHERICAELESATLRAPSLSAPPLKLAGLRRCQRLSSLTLHSVRLTDLAPLRDLPIRGLRLYRCSLHAGALGGLRGLDALERLEMIGCSGPGLGERLAGLGGLRHIWISGSAPPMSLPRLETLTISDNADQALLKGASLPALQAARFSRCQFRSLPALTDALDSLVLDRLALESLGGLPRGLRLLEIRGQRPPRMELAGLEALERVALAEMTGALEQTELDALAALPSLRRALLEESEAHDALEIPAALAERIRFIPQDIPF